MVAVQGNEGSLRLLPAGNASEWTGPTGNNTYLLPAAPSVLIDAGIGETGHLESIAVELAGAPLALVLVTHGHLDHMAGAPSLSVRWPRVVLRGAAVGQPIADGELFDAGGTRLRAIHTPGHAPDHFCFHDEGTRELFCGDLVRIGGTVVIPASRGGNLREYVESLRRIRHLSPIRLRPAHGPAIEDPTAVIDEYIEHRRSRHRQIASARDAGCYTPAEIVALVYRGLAPALTAAAEDTVRAHLQALDAGDDLLA